MARTGGSTTHRAGTSKRGDEGSSRRESLAAEGMHLSFRTNRAGCVVRGNYLRDPWDIKAHNPYKDCTSRGTRRDDCAKWSKAGVDLAPVTTQQCEAQLLLALLTGVLLACFICF